MVGAASGASRVAVARPLYIQVRDLVLERINRGDWSAGDTLPNEFQLSTEFAVSIGTIRRAISLLEDAGIVVRKQGRGTYLSGPDSQRIAKRFWTLRTAQGGMIEPDFVLESVRHRSAESAEAAALDCAMGTDLFEIEQSLQLDRKVIGFERTIVEAKRFPKLESQLRYGQDLNMLYRDYGVIQTRASDTVRACLAAPDVAARLAIAADAFVVEITRVSYGIDDRAIELKKSWLAAGAVVHRSEIT